MEEIYALMLLVGFNFGKLCEQVRIFHLGLNRAVNL